MHVLSWAAAQAPPLPSLQLPAASGAAASQPPTTTLPPPPPPPGSSAARIVALTDALEDERACSALAIKELVEVRKAAQDAALRKDDRFAAQLAALKDAHARELARVKKSAAAGAAAAAAPSTAAAVPE